jgi:hypothetical protein
VKARNCLGKGATRPKTKQMPFQASSCRMGLRLPHLGCHAIRHEEEEGGASIYGQHEMDIRLHENGRMRAHTHNAPMPCIVQQQQHRVSPGSAACYYPVMVSVVVSWCRNIHLAAAAAAAAGHHPSSPTARPAGNWVALWARLLHEPD